MKEKRVSRAAPHPKMTGAGRRRRRARDGFDPVALEVFNNLFRSVAEEMGASLSRTAHSPNVRDRRDFSCAVFDSQGRVVAQAEHIPVHLGSMHFAVRSALAAGLAAGAGTWLLNDPYAGGTHLPDITLVTPVRIGRGGTCFYVASRAHHLDMGGASGGSMGAHSEIFAEGLRIPPVPIVDAGGVWERSVLDLIRANVRSPEFLEGDLTAQYAANQTALQRLAEMADRFGLKKVLDYAGHLRRYSARRMRIMLASFPEGVFRAEDFLEDDGFGGGPFRIRASVEVRSASVRVDFAGTDPQVHGPVNAPLPVTWSCVQYVLRTLTDPDIPNNSGCFEAVRLYAPPGTLVNAVFPAAVAGGNVETSQRIVDCLYKALADALPERIPAASCGSMNNLSVSGQDPRSGGPFSYYETVAGGMGARPGLDGLSGVHTHMTNTRNTPVEMLEHVYPMRVERYALRHGSGGGGRYRGGDGLVREILFLADSEIHLLAERRHRGPPGLWGADAGKPGRDFLIREGKKKRLPPKGSVCVRAGDRLRMETPGGGGWGAPGKGL
ncbi:MAG: hydantoinase B/oxoprolinase family protein [bacterium]